MTAPLTHASLLEIPESEWVASNALAFAIRAPSPVCPDHTLVALRRWVPSYLETSDAERAALRALIDEVKAALDQLLWPASYEVAFAMGQLAGGAVPEAAIHVMPRPRPHLDAAPDGRRHRPSTPEATITSNRSRPLATGGDLDPLGKHLWPLFASATEIAIVAAFVTETGLRLLRRHVFAALRAGANLRIVTGDYLAFNQVDALWQLLGWSQLDAATATDADASATARPGTLRVRVVETGAPDGSERAFHPKAWLFESATSGVAFVGSSNLSRSALETGIEWNLRVERAIDPVAYACVRAAVDALWATTVDLTAPWIEDYARRVRQQPRSLPPGEADAEPLEPPPPPHEFQTEALAALARAREQGRRRALVVLATGLGKTWLAAYDVAQLARTTGCWPRVLFLAHREELLAQAALTFRRLLASAGQAPRVGWCAGDLLQPEPPVVVALVQKLARAENLQRVRAEPPDYVIVDEVHHADAPTYRRVLDALDPGFLLGLTATPDRADEGDVLALFDDFVAYRADLGAGIAGGRLVPFAYHGVRDDIDYAQIPWRNRRFDPAALAAATQTLRRMDRLWQAWLQHPGTRTLVFCCSIEHAQFAATWLSERDVRVAAVFAGPGSADRSACVAQLAQGELDALCVVDMFNEGVDIPAVDRVVMLRPTESPVVFLQQLGRGLRRHPGKERLTIIDFVGNHRIFLDRVRRLLSLVSSPSSLCAYLESGAPPDLPPGCSVDLELEVKQLLQTFLPRGALEVERVYRELVLSRGERPSIGELHRMGYRPSTLRRAHGSWFRFVAQEGHLDEDETHTLESLGAWLDELEADTTQNALELLVLEALLEADALTAGLPLAELARRSQALLARSPELLGELSASTATQPPAPDPADPLAFWREHAAAWTRGQRWYALEDDRLAPRRLAPGPGTEPALTRMTRELVDYRLHLYRSRTAPDLPGNAFRCTVLWNQRDPILKLPALSRSPERPTGELDVRLPDGSVWRFRFAKEFCNVARPAGTDRNRLPDLLRDWFGPAAGHPGTRFEVQFSRSPDGWWIEPLGGSSTLPQRGLLLAYPSLRAAAGAAADGRSEEPEPERVSLPFDGPPDVFAVRAAGDSMNGGKTPIQDGDWLVMRWARGANIGSMAGRVALVQTPDGHGTFAYQIKRIVQQDERWWLRSDNPQQPAIEATADTTPIAQLVSTISPEALAPPVGERLATDTLGAAFGLKPETSIERDGRYDGHLFLLVSAQGQLTYPDRLARVVSDRRPAETAFVLARPAPDDPWRYCGVARWLDDEGAWCLPELDFATWRALGKGRNCSRRLPTEATRRATEFLDELWRRTGPGTWMERAGTRCRLLERTAAGVRIDGGDGGFRARPVSVTDVAWVLLAADDVARTGGVLDKARINRLRYLEGTPEGSTRWIDTKWAIVLVVGEPIAMRA